MFTTRNIACKRPALSGQRCLASTILGRKTAVFGPRGWTTGCFWMRSRGGPPKAGEGLLRVGCCPPAKESEEQPQYQPMLRSAEQDGNGFCSQNICGPGWHTMTLLRAIPCSQWRARRLTKINFWSEPFSGGTLSQNAEFRSHYVKRCRRAKWNKSPTELSALNYNLRKQAQNCPGMKWSDIRCCTSL